MLKIYFDDVLINDDCYTELSNTYKLFDNSFYLGSTAANTYKITIINDAIQTQPTEVKIYDGTTLLATLDVDNIEENDDGTTTYTLTDAMVRFDGFKYNAQDLIEQYGDATIIEILMDIGDKANVDVVFQWFPNWNRAITWWDNRISAREYISYIAELAGGYARITPDGRLEIKQFKNISSETITLSDTSGYKIGEHYKFTKVVYDNEAGNHFEAGDDTGNTYYLNKNNVYITSQLIVDTIYNSFKNFEFYNITIDNAEIDITNQVGSIITFTDGTNNYPTIVGREFTYNGTWLGGYSLQLDTEKQSETNISGSSDFYRNVEARLNRDENMIEFLAEQVQEVSREVNGVNSITLTDASKGFVHQLIISGDFGIPIVRDNNDPFILYPSRFRVKDKFYLRVIKNGNILQELDLPFIELRYISSTVKDTFEIIENVGTLTKMVGVDYNGNYYPLATPETTTFEDLGIESPGGDFTISINNDSLREDINLYSHYLLKNDYTDIFATKIELQAGMKTTSDEVKLYVDGEIDDVEDDVREVQGELSLKLGKSEYGTLISMLNAAADEITLEGGSKINLTTAGKLLISAGNFQLDNTGKMTCDTAVVRNATITGSIIKGEGYTENDPVLQIGRFETAGDSVGTIIYDNSIVVIDDTTEDIPTISTQAAMGTASLSGGSITCTDNIETYGGNILCDWGDIHADNGYVYALNIGSDKRKKKNIKKTKIKAIEDLKKIETKEFDWKKDDKHVSIGFIAQELEKINEDYVLIDPNGNYYINELPLIATLVKAIQEQQEQIDKLENKLKEVDK